MAQSAAPVTSGSSGPEVRVTQALAYDFGSMKTGQEGERTWVLANSGGSDLKLTLLQKPSCGCTVASLEEGEERVVRPGQTTDLTVRWKVNSAKENYHQAAVIGTNDPGVPKIDLVVKGRIYAPVGLSAQALEFGPVDSRAPHGASIVVSSEDKADLAITRIIASRPDIISTTIKPLRQPSGRKGGLSPPTGSPSLSSRACPRVGFARK
jgi:hypothetical protein